MDTAIFDGNRADFGVGGSSGNWIVTELATGQSDVITSVEFLRFLDATVQPDQIL